MPDDITTKEFFDLLRITDQENPMEADVHRLRDVLAQKPELIDRVGDLVIQAQQSLIHHMKMGAGMQVLIETDVDSLCSQLGHEKAPALERLLIQQICNYYLRLYLWEYQYHAKVAELSPLTALEWERLLSVTQRSFLRAIETLARVRKLGVNIQVNIATNGGQQINVNSVESKE